MIRGTSGTFFDPSKYNFLVKGIIIEDMDSSGDYVPMAMEVPDDSGFFEETSPKNPPKLRGGFNRKTFDFVMETQRRAKTDHLMKAHIDFSVKEEISVLRSIAEIGKRYCNGIGKMRKLGKIFADIAALGEKYTEKVEISVEKAVTIKYLLGLSRSGYE